MNVWVLSLTFESFKKFEQEQRRKKETYQHNIMRSGDFSDSPEADLLFFGFDLGLNFEHLNITLYNGERRQCSELLGLLHTFSMMKASKRTI